MKIVSTGKTLASSEFYQKKLKARRKKLLIFSALFLVVLTLIVFSLRWSGMRISTINVLGAEVISPEVVVSSASDILSGYYLWVIPKNNILVYPRQRLVQEIHSRFPRFRSIDISLTNLTALDVVVLEREPLALYCGGVAKPDETSECYFLDAEGFIFDQAPSFSTGVYFVFATDGPLESPLGQEFLPPLEFKSILEFIQELSSLGFQPMSLKLSSEEFRLLLANHGEILWLRQSSLERISSNLKSFLSEPSIAGDPNFKPRIMELDLRTEDKVFYRFNDE